MLDLVSHIVPWLLGVALGGLSAGWIWRNRRVRELSRELGSLRPKAVRLMEIELILAERNGELAALRTEIGDLRAARGASAEPVQSELYAPLREAAEAKIHATLVKRPSRKKSGESL